MKFSTLMLAEHVTIIDGLVNILAGSASRLGRPAFPAPLNLYLVAVVQIPPEYADGRPVGVRIAVSSSDDTQVLARVEGSFNIMLREGAAPETAAAPLAIDLRGVALAGPGLYRVDAVLEGQEPEHLYFDVVQADLPGITIPSA